MKHYISIIMLALVVMATSCRKDSTPISDPNFGYGYGYNTYAGQFNTIWNGINSSYAHWSFDTVDWDARYNRMLPKFRELDSLEYVETAKLNELYSELLFGLVDHHMVVKVRNIKPAPNDSITTVVYSPGSVEVKSRSYYHPAYSNADFIRSLQHLRSQGHTVTYTLDSCQMESMGDFYVITAVIDESYYYLHMTNFGITAAMEMSDNDPGVAVRDRLKSFFEATYKPECKAFILDNRANGGGYVNDLRYVVSPYVENDMLVGRIRSKSGLGRLDYTPWIDFVVHQKKEGGCNYGLPVVVLADCHSVSMGEMSTASIKMLPRGVFVGERTWGGHGILTGDFHMFYNGTFGDMNDYHFVYTTTFQNSFVDGGILEGRGIIPDVEVYNNYDAFVSTGEDAQLSAALQELARMQMK